MTGPYLSLDLLQRVRVTGRQRTERRLLAAAFRGDERAVGAIHDTHAGALYQIALLALGTGAAAEDVVTDVILEACTPPGLHLGDTAEASLRFKLVRRTFERCLDRRPSGTGGSARTILALVLFSGCSRPEVALIAGCGPTRLPVLLGRHLRAVPA